MKKETKFPKVGVGVIVIDPISPCPLFLLGKRKNKDGHGDGQLAFPGGKFEEWETFEDCCRREVMEEAGIEIENIRPFCFTNDMWKKLDLHYVTLFFIATMKDGQTPQVMEPDKCEYWDWFNLDKRHSLYQSSPDEDIFEGKEIPPEGQLFTPLNKIIVDKKDELLYLILDQKIMYENGKKSRRY